MYFDRPHDLLRIAPQALLAGSVLPWVSDHLRLSRCVVVRRTARAEPRIPVGVRGSQRHQRWAATCQPEWIEAIATPSQLLQCAVSGQRANTSPAFHALETLKDLWKDLSLAWGPGALWASNWQPAFRS